MFNSIPRISREVAIALIVATILAALAYIYGFFDREWLTAEKPIVIDFTDKAGCRTGKLSNIVRQFFPNPDVVLSNGATDLTICHKDRLVAVRAEIPRDLSNMVPGCVVWQEGSSAVVMVRKSSAICELPDHRGYVCDGMNAAHRLGHGAQGDSSDEVIKCTADLMRRFGF